MQDVSNLRQFYSEKGFSRRIGFGETPAVLVIDLMKTATDERSPWGSNMQPQLKQTLRILTVARKARIPVIFFVVSYVANSPDATRMWFRKQPVGFTEFFAAGTEWVDLDTILERRSDEVIITKKYASGFFGTNLVSLLNAQGIDTIIIVGCSTSGCVRATAVDGASYEFRVIIAEEAVGDRSELSHQVSLADTDSRYGDVVSVDSVIEYLTTLVQK